MINNKIKEYLLDEINKDFKKYKKDYKKLLDNRKSYGATYKEEVLPTLYDAYFYSDEDFNRYKKMIDILMSIVEKVTKEYVRNEEYRKLFSLDSLSEKLILKDPGYDISTPIARFDVMYDGRDEYKFCELNTDGSSAMLEDKSLQNLIKDSEIYKKLLEKYKISYSDLLQTLVDSIESLYKSIKGDRKINIAIVDIVEFDNIEFRTIRDLFIKKGHNCKIANLKDLKRKDGGLYIDDMKIDLVYRRLVTSDLIENKEIGKDFIDSYLNDEIVTIGSFRSTLFYTKDIFRILRLEQTKKILTNEENLFIEKHIPFTEKLIYERDKEKLLENKDKYILKPIQGYASHGIYVGKEEDKENFEKILTSIKNKNYIYQEYYEVEPLKFIEVKEDRAIITDFSFVTGLFAYNKKFIGPYMRIGNAALISSLRDYYVVSSMNVKENK
ncbi:glutathionylspermidine synthase family protein [Anaerococcus porci]|uniref:glutathionylspermidine synthase family protein n=1 Tax=Anaerococcus porci TaxID=2652269 RepID=UPI002A74AA59|nr:glutathionylspermidine synthase family protein [Anaerococcus porci]MDY3005564.1 glutathionylspermidine synthase family protein [Anaerococcus porci]